MKSTITHLTYVLLLLALFACSHLPDSGQTAGIPSMAGTANTQIQPGTST